MRVLSNWATPLVKDVYVEAITSERNAIKVKISTISSRYVSEKNVLCGHSWYNIMVKLDVHN